MKRVWWPIVAAITAAMVLTYLLSQRHAEAAPAKAAASAKQAATTGEVETTRDYLKQVKERGGKKLLSQIDFDPMWEIVKDDPEVRKLLEG